MVRSLMTFHQTILVAAGVVVPGFAVGGATIEGRVELPKAQSPVVMNQRYEVVTRAGAISTSPPLAVVYLEGSFRNVSPAPTKVIEQKNLTFVPLILPVQVGTRIEFPNLDDTYHNVFSYSPAKRFDLGRYRRNEKPVPAQIFARPGLVTLRCDIHEHMRGLILVVATPYFALSDTDGHYRLTGLPAGHYTLKAWLTSKSTLEQPVDLKNGATIHVDFP